MDADAIDRLIDPAAEMHLVGALTLWPERLVDVRDTVQAEDFFVSTNAELYRAICALDESGTPVRPDSLLIHLGVEAPDHHRHHLFVDLIADAMISVTSAAHAMYHARRVAELSTLRRVRGLARETAEEASDVQVQGKGEGTAFLEETERRLFEISQQRPSAGEVIGGDVIMAELMAALETDVVPGFPCGIQELDRKLGGLRPEEMIVLAARPSVGKTAFALQLAKNALTEGKSVLFLSLEMSSEQLISRLAANEGEVEAYRIRARRLDGEDRERLKDAAHRMRDWKLWIVRDEQTTVERLRTHARRTKAKHGLDLIIVDYLQLMSSPGQGSRNDEVTRISNALKRLARELQVTMLAVAQLNRGAATDEPNLHNLRDSGSIEQDADAVVFLWGDDKSISCKLGKQRNGEIGPIPIMFDRRYQRFYGLERSTIEWTMK